MLSALRRLPRLGRAWRPLSFSSPDFTRIPPHQKIEETLPDYVASRYYPVRIGDIFQDRYQVVGKLGFGSSSTVWLARDLSHRRHVALKLFIHSAWMGEQVDDELNIYKRIEKGSRCHPGYDAVRKLLDSFDVDGPDGRHRCLVHAPLWESVLTFLHRNPVRRLPTPIVAFILKNLFLALDFLHAECEIIHTDIKADNIMFAIEDGSVFTHFEEQELQEPCPRKELNGRTIYVSRELRKPKKFGGIDIWNTGCMIWDIFEGGHLFTGHDPELQTYRSRAHISEMMALLGPPPQDLLTQGKSSHRFFMSKGEYYGGTPLEPVRLDKIETSLEGQDKERFLRFMRKMLQWEPDKRHSALELLEDEWVRIHTE